MIRHFTISLVLLVSLVTIAGAQTPPGVNVKLSFAENKTVYRIGEPIKLVMEFTADREGYIVESLPDGNEPGSDTAVISPDIGITRWYDEFNSEGPYGRHVFSTTKLTATPKRIEIIINDRMRFDSAGRYTVSVTTRRISQASQPPAPSKPFIISTNALKFEIVAMSEADEEKEVKRLSALLDAKPETRNDEISRRLSYLTGDPSTQEKLRRFLSDDFHAGNSNMHRWNGLFIARNRTLVLKLLEARIRDANRPVTLPLLTLATRFKTFLTHGARETSVNPAPGLLERWESPEAREIRNAYVAEMAAGLGKRTGENQTTTAFTILTAASPESETTGAGRSEARQVLVQHFDSLQPFTQDLLLRSHWETIRDEALIPSLKKILVKPDNITSKSTTLQRLMELAPDEARPFVIAEICDRGSRVEPAILGALEDKSLPEVDAALLDQIRRATTSNHDRIYLKFKVVLLVRFATDTIYQELMEVYRRVGEKLPSDSRAGLLAYFAKHNEREAIPMIEKVVAEFKPGGSPWVLSELTTLYYSDSIGVILKKLLESDDYAHASHAAYLIGREGAAGDERVLEARLKRWREDWRDRIAEGDAQNQGQVERELVWALINGKSWKFAPERIEELRNSCITNLCKQSNLVRQ